MTKYYVDERSGCIAIREFLPDGQEYDCPGLNEESKGVVHFWASANIAKFENGYWKLDSEFVKKVNKKCAIMNGELAPTPPKAFIRNLRIENVKTKWGDTFYDFYFEDFEGWSDTIHFDDPELYFKKALEVIDEIVYSVTIDHSKVKMGEIEWDYLPSDDL